MFRLIPPNTKINFLGSWAICALISGALILTSIGSMVYHGGLKYGVDFKGGTLMQLKFAKPADLGELRSLVGGLDLGDFSIQEFGRPEEILMNLAKAEETAADQETTAMIVEKTLRGKYGQGFSVERVEVVGPKVGADLKEKAMLAIFYSIIGILIYITLRFEFKFGVAAIVATAHDAIISVGAFSIMDKEFTLTVLAAILTVIGYSLNDTIVVFDRVRENLRLRRGMPLIDILNLSVNQTLSRTILTSGATLITLLALFFLGGEVIHDFAFALTIGVLIGTYSSIYVASPVVMIWSRREREKHGRAAASGAGKRAKV
ncbi:MAG: protein translocase subunit SecF [Nitrospinota bacterium]|nr:protein translocase subunit SecF [Nitrospinota bacterium]